ncbi:MAG TPA: hypothetical protein VJP45_07280 [Candidatus Limnocylindria bacterium]|nr:hypothetical protein [Candidatus Limnocylindria bacterium]
MFAVLVFGLMVGIALGTLVVAFVAVGEYERGFAAAGGAAWRAELRSRRAHARHPGGAAAA